MNDWLATLSPEDRLRFDWENHPVTRRTTGGPSPRRPEAYWGHHVARQSIDYIDEAIGRKKPFLCWASFWEPHPPFYPPADIYAAASGASVPLAQPPATDVAVIDAVASRRAEWAHLTDVERRQMVCGYYGLVALLDGFIEQIISHLERIGELDRTIIVFTSDHGEQLGEHGLFLKFVMREASVRVPLWIRAPGITPAGHTGIVEHIDLVPTLAELAGVEVPNGVSGVSLLPILRGDREGAGFPADRYALSQIEEQVMLRGRKWKLNVYEGVPAELFDIENDPGEISNLIGRPEHRGRIAGMLEEIRRRGVK